MKKAQSDKQPKTELDKKFLEYVGMVMADLMIDSDRSMSIELSRHPDFINRVRNGVQSAPPEAWDILLSKYKVEINFTKVGEKQQTVIGNEGAVAVDNTGTTTTNANINSGSALAQENEMLKRENESLRSQLRDKERIIQLLESQLNK